MPKLENCQVLRNEWVNDEYKEIVLQSSLEISHVEPGQFFQLTCPVVDENTPFFPRPMSTYLADKNGRIGFLYKIVGEGTKGLSTLKEDDTLRVLGPLGKGFSIKDSTQHILIIGRGVGLATLASLSEYAKERNVRVTTIISARDEANILSHERFSYASDETHIVLDSKGNSDVASLNQLIEQIHANNPIDEVYTCGSRRLILLLKDFVQKYAISGQVAYEEQMSCGIGMCYGCMKPMYDKNGDIVDKKVCRDGPVFDLMEIV